MPNLTYTIGGILIGSICCSGLVIYMGIIKGVVTTMYGVKISGIVGAVGGAIGGGIHGVDVLSGSYDRRKEKRALEMAAD